MHGSNCAVTGALGYTGRAVAEQLLARGARVRTLTNSPGRPNPFGPRLEICPLAFGEPETLRRSLTGVEVLFNTYWVRFNHRQFNFAQAVRNTRVLFEAAKDAGVRRIVHVSILHANEADDLAYYRGKHELEDALRASGAQYAIVRPGVLFGRGDILLNNIAWALRRFPVLGVFGDGAYRLRPLHVDDMARLMIECAERSDDLAIDAVGPESFSYRELATRLAEIIGVRRAIVGVPPTVGYIVCKAVDPLVGDVVITWEEILGLMRGLLDSEAPASGSIRLTDWARQHAHRLGWRYASEVGRRVKRDLAYEMA